MNVSAVIVTRGDCDLSEILDSLPRDWQKVIYDNSRREHDLSVYGRYAAIEECEHETIFVQDDDCVLAPESLELLRMTTDHPGAVIANMPQRFRDTGFYDDHCLLGFGAIFHRDMPAIALGKFARYFGTDNVVAAVDQDSGFLHRTCDVVFTSLTPRILLDLPYRDLPWATDASRMYRQPDHVGERARMLELCRQVRDA
jgi:hypothetical protein